MRKPDCFLMSHKKHHIFSFGSRQRQRLLLTHLTNCTYTDFEDIQMLIV